MAYFQIMDNYTDKGRNHKIDNLEEGYQKEQLKALIEKMKQEGKPIDWATAVLC